MKHKTYKLLKTSINNTTSFRGKIVSIFLIFSFILSITIGSVCYYMVYNKMLSNTIDYVYQLASQISRNTELMTDEASKVLQLGESDISFNFLYATNNRQEETMELIKLFKLYRDSYVLSKNIKNVYIMGADGVGFSERHGIYFIEKDENSQHLYDVVSQNDNELLVLSGKESGESDNNSIIIGKSIIQPGTRKKLGITVVEFETKEFQSLYENVTLGSTGRFTIIDNTMSQIISENSNVDLTAIKDTLLEKDSGYFLYEQNTLFIYETIPNTKWKIIGKVQISELMQDTYELGRIFAYAILLILVFLAALYIIMSKSLINPITKLRDNMLLAEKGDLDARVNVTGHDEIAVLARQYNRMLSRIKNLMEENKLEQRNLQKAELKALQAQINPHFLYNTLDTVIWLAAANENEKVINIVEQLAVFFRLGLSNGVEWINVEKEIEHVKSYLSIQQVRYSDMLKYDIEIDQKIYGFTMLKMILQPIVENALYHGIKQNEKGGAISIKGKLINQNDIIFEISDTGAGIEEDFLMDLMNSIQKNKDTYMDNENGFGLYNVNRRIRLYYGEDYGISVWSQAGEGTVVTVRIRGEGNGNKDL